MFDIKTPETNLSGVFYFSPPPNDKNALLSLSNP